MSTDRRVAVSVEISGRKTTIALVDCRGHVIHATSAKTLRGRSAEATLSPYLRAIEALLEYARSTRLSVCGIGVSIPGSLDPSSRCPQCISFLPALKDFPLCDLFEVRFQLPTRLYSDVDAALLAEHYLGAGKGFQRLLLITVNAVVGAALVVDGQLEREPSRLGHICHVSVATSGPRCSCGKRGCINTLVSMDAIQRMVQRALRRGEETSLIQRLLDREYCSPQLLIEEAQRGDRIALQIYNEIGRWLRVAIEHYLDRFQPHILILGGGEFYQNELLLSQIQHTSALSRSIDIVPTQLGAEASLIGAVVPLFAAVGETIGSFTRRAEGPLLQLWG